MPPTSVSSAAGAGVRTPPAVLPGRAPEALPPLDALRAHLMLNRFTYADEPVTAQTAVLEPTKQQIRERAYFLYLERGGQGGDAVSDWLEAEQQLRAELVVAARHQQSMPS